MRGSAFLPSRLQLSPTLRGLCCLAREASARGPARLLPGFGAVLLRLPGIFGIQACKAGGSERKIFLESMTHLP
jgi:hypothetical protein